MSRVLLLIAALALPQAAGAQTSDEDFAACLAGLSERARNEGVAPAIIDRVVPAVEYQSRVIELDRQQPEFLATFGDYLSTRVTEQRVARGRELYSEYADFLEELGERYQVPGRYLIAFWGLETNFGGYLGRMPTLDSLATLACDERRSRFFSEQFVAALKMLEKEGLEPDRLRGSWAGAMGHTQFMPTTYARYAVDGDGDGRIDLFGSPRDALASGANFLQQLGWESGTRWGREVRLPKGFDFSKVGLGHSQPLSAWVDAGITRADGSALPSLPLEASLLVPAGSVGPAFLVYSNFRVIMGWNRSEYYALSVGHLADRIAGGGRLLQPPPDQRALSRAEVIAMQDQLRERGYPVGPSDGIMGATTRLALRQFQRDVGLTPDGFPDALTLSRLKGIQRQ